MSVRYSDERGLTEMKRECWQHKQIWTKGEFKYYHQVIFLKENLTGNVLSRQRGKGAQALLPERLRALPLTRGMTSSKLSNLIPSFFTFIKETTPPILLGWCQPIQNPDLHETKICCSFTLLFAFCTTAFLPNCLYL